jgi:hypothetical protein
MAEGADRDRALRNLVRAAPLGRLEAWHELRKEVEAWLDRAELELVRACRSRLPPDTWDEIGRALEMSHTQAQRKFKHRL